MEMAGCRRNPKGRADPHRIAASLVVAILLLISMASSLLLALLAARPVAAMWVFHEALLSEGPWLGGSRRAVKVHAG